MVDARQQPGSLLRWRNETFVDVKVLGGRPVGLPSVGNDGRTILDVGKRGVRFWAVWPGCPGYRN